jgi:sec-independent protein translocase protein TatB
MFDVGFFELLVIGVVTLLVVGPERLPKVARTAGMWLGRGRRFVRSVKQDIDAEIKADELREIIEKQKIDNPLHEIIEDTRQDLEQIRSGTESAVKGESSAKADAQSPAWQIRHGWQERWLTAACPNSRSSVTWSSCATG